MDTYYKKIQSNIDKELLKDLNPKRSSLENAISYALSLKGKRLRPVLFLSLIESLGLDHQPHVKIAVAIEYIHTYSLIHDDLPAMDNDDIRRGMPTVHKKFNEAVALLAGDTLLTMAFEKIADSGIKPEKIVNILRILTKSIGLHGMAGGQALDLEFSGDREKIFEIHKKKTAELIKGTLLSAAEIAEMGIEEKKELAIAGEKIGTGFQLADDLLDMEGDEAEVGKRIHKDMNNKSPNSVIYFGVDSVKNMIDKLYTDSLSILKNVKIESDFFLNLVKMMFYRSR